MASTIESSTMFYQRMSDLIGSTPLVAVPLTGPARCYAKLEYLNPGGSIKDRAARYMIEQAETHGLLKPGGTVIEASSGNQGIAAAYIGATKGYRVIITMSDKVSKEKQATIAAYGAEIIICPATATLDDPHSYHSVAQQLAASIPNSFMLNQYFNLDNSMAHYVDLGPEIWRQTEGKITHFFAAAGSGGTVNGVGRYLKEQNPSITIIGVDAATSYRSTGGNPKPYAIEGMGVDYDTPQLRNSTVDDFVAVPDREAFDMLRILARRYGILVGPPSGAVAYAVQHYFGNHTAAVDTALVVMLFGDSGRAYLSKEYYSQPTNYRVYGAVLPSASDESRSDHHHMKQADDASGDLC